jgi:protein-S-isoprenylcysteine O-methyltransferase Ste14
MGLILSWVPHYWTGVYITRLSMNEIALHPLVSTWPHALVFWAVFLWTFIPEGLLLRRQRRTTLPRAQDAGSVRVILLGNSVATWCAFALAYLQPGATIMTHRVVIFWTGVALLAAGGILRRHCFRMLGDFFSGVVVVQPGQPVIERGAYHLVRHPSYSAAFLIWGGIGLALTNWLSLLLLLTTSAIVYGYRVRVEERALVQTLGQPYIDYMNRTKRFIPFVF